MKLNKDLFYDGLAYLKIFYIKWEFDLNDEVVLSVWYGVMDTMSSKRFQYMINEFTKNSEYPPRSPNDLLKEVRGMEDWLLDMEIKINPPGAFKVLTNSDERIKIE